MAKKSAYVVELREWYGARFIGGCTTYVTRYWWRLRSSGNWRILGHSENYMTKRARDKTALRLAKALGAEVREAK